MADIQSDLIKRQEQTIRKLKAENAQLREDLLYTKKVLAITLRDNLKGPVVISDARMAEINPEFDMGENWEGERLVTFRWKP